jgi:DNA repair photolyase
LRAILFKQRRSSAGGQLLSAPARPQLDGAPEAAIVERMFRLHNPVNRFHGVSVDWDEPPLPAKLVLREEDAKTILQHNDSPDIGFDWSLSPYRGCTHACIFCYARNSHEYFDLSAGTDFERILFVKRRAAVLLDEALSRPSWKGEPITLSGITDCYQPIERKLGITRACVEVMVRYRNPVNFITRSPLIVRDLDLLVELAAHRAVRVQISIPIGDPVVCRALEPGTAPPAARLRAVRILADAGVPVGVSVAPIIPGLTDHLLADTLRAAHDAGATWAWKSLLRLPGSVEAVFTERLREVLPLRAEAVLDRIRRTQGARPHAFHERMRGHDESWRMTEALFDNTCRRLGLGKSGPAWPEESPFRRPGQGKQLGFAFGGGACGRPAPG